MSRGSPGPSISRGQGNGVLNPFSAHFPPLARPTPTTDFLSVGLASGVSVWLMADMRVFAGSRSVVKVCGRFTTRGALQQRGFSVGSLGGIGGAGR